MEADLAPAEAEAKEDEGGGREANEQGHETLGAGQLLLKFAEAEIRETEGGVQKREACVVSNLPSCLGLKRGGCPGSRGLAGMYFEVFSWRPLSSSPFMKLVRKACVASWEPLTVPSSSRRLPCPLYYRQGEEHRSEEVSLQSRVW